MNRPAAVARDIAQFMLDLGIEDPCKLTAKEYDELKPPYRSVRVKIYFLTFARGMSLASRHMARLTENEDKKILAKPVSARNRPKKTVIDKTEKKESAATNEA